MYRHYEIKNVTGEKALRSIGGAAKRAMNSYVDLLIVFRDGVEIPDRIEALWRDGKSVGIEACSIGDVDENGWIEVICETVPDEHGDRLAMSMSIRPGAINTIYVAYHESDVTPYEPVPKSLEPYANFAGEAACHARERREGGEAPGVPGKKEAGRVGAAGDRAGV